ncbi:MAG: response regulator transcription factor [Deltaproteobacteria bacterium]|nr:response regulator transcription factor [Deltaproteobacteria bacterium]
MTALRVVVLEDEAPARRLLVRLLSELAPEARVIAELESLADAREVFANERAPIDLVISDIRLADGSALALFEEGVIEAPVIFVTAYDAWIEEAFRHLSVDYLLKPIDREAFARALAKLDRMKRLFGRDEAREAAALVSRRPRERILVRHKAEQRALAVREIAYLKADDKLTLAIDREGREHLVDRTLGQLEKDLEGAEFFRLNRGFLAHASAIVSFRSGGRGRIEVTLAPPTTEDVLVSQENAAAFRAFLDR